MTTTQFRYYKPFIKDNISIVLSSHHGVDAIAFFDLADLSGFKREQVAQLFDTSLKTLLRYRDTNRKLSPATGELVLKMLALFQHGEEIFGSISEFRDWLGVPAYGLGNQIPFELMQTSGGIDLIDDELSRIEHGALA
ncbi:type II RES/Xre toxin-antitoxin system antitoxin [Spirosoma arcticum]